MTMTPTRPTSETPAHATPSGPLDTFPRRHIGPDEREVAAMLQAVGFPSLDALCDAAMPDEIQLTEPMRLDRPTDLTESEAIAALRAIAIRNKVTRSCIGMGYHASITPPVIQRNILENPGWYTQYTPYQAEISQGRLEALLNFQTMIADLTALPLANASLLDEATAAAEAMAMCHAIARNKRPRFLVDAACHPQTIGVVQTRAETMGIDVVIGDAHKADFPTDDTAYCGVLVQWPTTDGRIECYRDMTELAHTAGTQVVAAADILALTLFTPPGEWGADICVGSAQRLGVPMGAGGPHAAFIATREEHARKMPGRIIGVSKDATGAPALRMAIQTREQHIKRDRATSNICTAQALLAVMASMYAVYHGAEGIREIATRIRTLTQTLRRGLLNLGHQIAEDLVFDTLRIKPVGRTAASIIESARTRGINLRDFADGTLGITLDETSDEALLADLLAAFGEPAPDIADLATKAYLTVPPVFQRTTPFLTHPVFNTHHSETEMLRYIKRLEERDLSLAHSMIPLGSCTMKLNATSEMLPVTWPEFASIHPFAPADQQQGYAELYTQLERWLATITGFEAVSLQPNAGSQGEYAGLLAIRGFHHARGDTQRDACIIPTSAHGTNPASAVIAGMRVVPVACDAKGNIDVADLRAKCDDEGQRLGALMVTYPSTHGVFEKQIKEICKIVHDHGGRVYMDGANMNAQVGLTNPAICGADVCHLNLHKTFCIPHGGGGPGMGPIACTAELAPFLPGHPVAPPTGTNAGKTHAVSAAPYGSPSILTISWMYIAMMGAQGLTRASQVAILNANYMASRLRTTYDVVYTGAGGAVAHEFIIDLRPVAKFVTAEDVAKRLMDYGFHAPTMSWPVAGTLMIEPTESETTAELDRFCDALIAIREEIAEIERGQADPTDNLLKNAPHTIATLTNDEWPHPYARQRAAYPAPWLRDRKFWPPVARIDNPYGDRNLICTCPTVEELA